VLLGVNELIWVCSGGMGGSLLAAATVMVGVFWVRIPMAAHIDSCTAEGVRLEIIYFPNYIGG